MLEIHINEDVDVYTNKILKFPYVLENTFSSKINLINIVEVNYIDLYFGTYQKICRGVMSIMFKTVGSEVSYVLDTSTLVDNNPVRFGFDKPFLCREHIEITFNVTYHTDNRIAIWTNNRGICGAVNTKYEERVLLEKAPKISILTPVYKTDIGLLKQTIESVKSQYYENWELCIVDDNSEDEEITRYLSSLTVDPRIKVKTRKTNGGIVEASNEAVQMATGLFFCTLDHDDLLDKKTILEIVKSYNKNEDADLFYSDEDKIDMDNNPYDPFYKPDWSYHHLLSQNILSHITAFKTDTVKELKGYRSGYDGAQDYDLVLRYIEKAKKIIHIPKILYHWRATPTSTASGHHLKPFSRINAVRSISEHLKRVKVKARVTSEAMSGVYRVDRVLVGKPSINIIIPFKDKVDYLKACLFSLGQSTYSNFTVTLVDNLSEEKETQDFIKDIPLEYCMPGVKKEEYIKVVKYDQPFNFSSINNYAVKMSKPTDLLLFMNNDTEVISTNWLEQMVQHAQRKEIGAVGPKLLYANGQIQHAGVIIGIGGVAGHSHKYMGNNHYGYFCRPHLIQELSAVTGACLMVRSEVFHSVSGFEESLPKAFNDIDLCLKIRQLGYKVIYTPYAVLYHYESISRGLDNANELDFQVAINYMLRKWDCQNFKDPYYNINLSLTDERFSFL